LHLTTTTTVQDIEKQVLRQCASRKLIPQRRRRGRFECDISIVDVYRNDVVLGKLASSALGPLATHRRLKQEKIGFRYVATIIEHSRPADLTSSSTADASTATDIAADDAVEQSHAVTAEQQRQQRKSYTTPPLLLLARRSPPSAAAEDQLQRCLQALIYEAGADVRQLNQRGDSLLHVCSANNNLPALTWLLTRKKMIRLTDDDIDVFNDAGDAAIDEALRGGHFDAARLLIECGAAADHTAVRYAIGNFSAATTTTASATSSPADATLASPLERLLEVMKSRRTIVHLPVEIQIHILGFINGVDVGRIRCVCLQWQALGADRALTKLVEKFQYGQVYHLMPIKSDYLSKVSWMNDNYRKDKRWCSYHDVVLFGGNGGASKTLMSALKTLDTTASTSTSGCSAAATGVATSIATTTTTTTTTTTASATAAGAGSSGANASGQVVPSHLDVAERVVEQLFSMAAPDNQSVVKLLRVEDKIGALRFRPQLYLQGFWRAYDWVDSQPHLPGIPVVIWILHERYIFSDVKDEPSCASLFSFCQSLSRRNASVDIIVVMHGCGLGAADIAKKKSMTRRAQEWRAYVRSCASHAPRRLVLIDNVMLGTDALGVVGDIAATALALAATNREVYRGAGDSNGGAAAGSGAAGAGASGGGVVSRLFGWRSGR